MSGEEQAVLETLQRYFAGYAQGDVELCMSTIAPTGPLLLFGTNADEIATSAAEVRAGLERDMAAMSDVRVGDLQRLHIEATATQAFALFEVSMAWRSAGADTTTQMRFALSLGKADGQWRIRSGLVSVPSTAGTYQY
jgi:ketosteroid isomerase-like protein